VLGAKLGAGFLTRTGRGGCVVAGEAKLESGTKGMFASSTPRQIFKAGLQYVSQQFRHVWDKEFLRQGRKQLTAAHRMLEMKHSVQGSDSDGY